MKHILIYTAFAAALCLATSAGAAECFADYKAKQDNPLRLHYGVAQLSGACSAPAARGELSARLSASGWTLLNVISVFGPDGLTKRKKNAGSYYLRF